MSSNKEQEIEEKQDAKESTQSDDAHLPFTSPDGFTSLIRSCIPSIITSNKKEDEDEVYRKADPTNISVKQSVTLPSVNTNSSATAIVASTPVYTATVQAQIQPDVVDPDSKDFVYQFTHKSLGLAVLIGNSDFDTEERTRQAAPLDIRNMYELFQNLGFHIEYLWNYKTQELVTKLRELAHSDLVKDTDCFACVISSHGSEQRVGKNERGENIPSSFIVYEHFISMKDGPIKTRDVLSIFDNDNCPALMGKPRLFFIQACRARMRPGKDIFDSGALDPGADLKLRMPPAPSIHAYGQYGYGNRQVGGMFTGADAQGAMWLPPADNHSSGGDTQGVMPFPLVEDYTESEMIPPVCLNDYLVMFASVSEKVGWSYDDKGGWLLLSLYDVLMKKIHQKERFCLLSALTNVSRKMALNDESFTGDPRTSFMKSVPGLEHKLCKDVVFDLTGRT